MIITGVVCTSICTLLCLMCGMKELEQAGRLIITCAGKREKETGERREGVI